MATKQTEIPGTERKTVKELDDAAETYVEKRDARMSASADEKTAKDALISAMKKNNVTVYRDENAHLTVTLVPGKDAVKVVTVEGDEAAEGEAS